MTVKFKAIVHENGKGVFSLFPAFCKGCGLCKEKCPVATIGWSDELGVLGTPVVEPGHGEQECIACGICQTVCPDCAIKIEKRKEK